MSLSGGGGGARRKNKSTSSPRRFSEQFCWSHHLRLGLERVVVNVAASKTSAAERTSSAGPEALFDFIQSAQPTVVESHSPAGRPCKRRRVSGTERQTYALSGYIPVCRVQLDVTPAAGQPPLVGSQVGTSVPIQIVNRRDGPFTQLSFTQRPTAQSHSRAEFHLTLVGDLDPGQHEDLRTLLSLASRSSPSPTLQIEAIMSVTAIGGSFCLTLFYRDGDFNKRAFSNTIGRRQSQEANTENVSSADSGSPLLRWLPEMFYSSIYTPPIDEPVTMHLDKSLLSVDLYPFQKRTLDWMIRREQSPGKSVSRITHPRALDGHAGFVYCQDVDGEPCYYSRHFSTYMRSPSVLLPDLPRGGILAEEMGLGKSVEVLALISTHRRPADPPLPQIEPLKVTGATLIVVPTRLQEQWYQQFSLHAPKLKWMSYHGIAPVLRSNDFADYDEDATIANMQQCDVVITTYAVLTKELDFTIDIRERPARKSAPAPRRKLPKSPLIQLEFWRVCLDEAQLVENFASRAAVLAARIPRVNAWAVSGTPHNKSDDLRGLFTFLRIGAASDNNTWNLLLHSGHPELKSLIHAITIRHSKAHLKELVLPPQSRHIVPLRLTRVEQEHYDTSFKLMARQLGCNLDGSPAHADWDPKEIEALMRQWVVSLRQMCLHPQTGSLNKRAIASTRTMLEVVDRMISQNDAEIRITKRSVIQAIMDRGHVLAYAGDNDRRAISSLELYQEALTKAEHVVSESRAELSAAKEACQRSIVTDLEDTDDTDPERVRLSAAAHSLRFALGLQHAAHFFIATASFQIKDNADITEPDGKEFKLREEAEMLHYDAAKDIRAELLAEETGRCMAHMQNIQSRPKIEDPAITLKYTPLMSKGEALVRDIFADVNTLAKLLENQWSLVVTWRGRLGELLLKPLVDKDEALTGEEYEISTKEQEEVYVLSDVFRGITADRSMAVTGHTNERVKHEMKVCRMAAKHGEGHHPVLMLELLNERAKFAQEGKNVSQISIRGLIQAIRETQACVISEVQASALDTLRSDLQLQLDNHAKTITVLERDVELFRLTMNQRLQYYKQLQAISDAVQPYKEELDETLDIVALEVVTERRSVQDKVLETLLTKSRFLANLRDDETNNKEPIICAICRCTNSEGILTVCGHRYCKDCIMHWFRQHKSCPLCKRKLSDADLHPITFMPKPRQRDRAGKWDETAKAHYGIEPADAVHIPEKEGYDILSKDEIAQINAVTLPSASFGGKTDAICRHLLHLRASHVGSGTAKTVIFSQFRTYLIEILGSALKASGIKYTCMSAYHRTNRKSNSNSNSATNKSRTPQQQSQVQAFIDDPTIDCFLLDAKTDSSGLNLVAAQNVILCEPLVNTAIEAQAIARVHRIGQNHATRVFLYVIEGSVEENILEIAEEKRRSTAAGTRRQQGVQCIDCAGEPDAVAECKQELRDAGRDAADQPGQMSALQTSALGARSNGIVQGKEGNEAVPSDDLWFCLFGRAGAAAGAQRLAGDAERVGDGGVGV